MVYEPCSQKPEATLNNEARQLSALRRQQRLEEQPMSVTPLLALMFEKVSGPRSLWSRLVHVRADCILTFQIFHKATSENL